MVMGVVSETKATYQARLQQMRQQVEGHTLCQCHGNFSFAPSSLL